MLKHSINKPQCFTDHQWKIYQTELQYVKNNKNLDICFDCTVEYQMKMRKEGKCAYPMKRLDKIAEYA
jgi:anaerobic ribonucleoside-triphosphate reductase